MGGATVDLFQDAPKMPTLQAMHQIVARHPTIQAKLFLLMERLVITEFLCIQGAFIGSLSLDALGSSGAKSQRLRRGECEDDYASNGEPGLANFATAMLEPLEAQGRGFEHGHKKVMGVPATRASALLRLFAEDDAAVLQSLQRIRDAVLELSLIHI